jgi:kumamolisin
MQLKHKHLHLGSRRTLYCALSASLFALSVAGCNAPTADPPQPTTTTLPQSLGPQQPQRVLHSKVIGRVPADQQIDLVLGMKLNDRSALDRLITRQADRHSADFRRWLTPATFATQFAPSAADYAALATTLTGAGFEVTRLVDGRSTMSVRGSAANVERLFSTELDVYLDNYGGKTPMFRAPSAAFSIPKALGLVDSVVGLDTAYPWVSHRKQGGTGAASPAGGFTSLTPAQLRTRYGLDTVTQKGEGETIAILGAGMGPSSADLAGYISTFGLSVNAAAQYTQILVGGPTREETAEAENEYGEDVLDIDMVMAMAPAASYIHVIVAENAGGLFGDGVSYVINQIPQAHQVTVSFGSCERLAVFSVGQTEALLAQALAQGQTWFFSAGDEGTDTCMDVDPGSPPSSFQLSVDYPASSQYALGVGGTQLAGNTEIAWSDEAGAGGGGLSELFPTPSYQLGVGPYQNQNARRVPDVSAMAGTPGVVVYYDLFGGIQEGTEGTSCAAPMWGGIWALLDQANGGVGIADYHDKVYGLAGTGFTDITMGTNSPGGGTMGYPAIVGYDLATGWGTPNVPALITGGL